MSKEKVYLHDFYNLGKEFVKNYPKHSLKCKRLQTFAVLEEYSDLNTPNLAKTISDRNKPFFFSRDWSSANYNPSKLEYSYPGLFIIDRSFSISNPFTKNVKTCYKMEIAVLDKFDRACVEKGGNCKPCAKRTRNEIFLDTETFLFNFFAYLRNIVYVKDEGWMIRSLAENQIDESLTRQFQKHLADSNKELNGIRWSGGLDDVYGSVIEFTFCVETCENFEYDHELKDFKVGYDRGCCE